MHGRVTFRTEIGMKAGEQEEIAERKDTQGDRERKRNKRQIEYQAVK